MTRIAFTKVQGTGNDFILIDGRMQRAEWRALAPRLCDRHFGIGADGLLIVEASQRAAVRMQIINADGSEAEMCGNGLRCFAKWAVEHGGLALANGGVEIETGAGVLQATFPSWMPGAGPIQRVRLSMGRPQLAPAEIPVVAEGPGPIKELPLSVDNGVLSVTCVSMGNPHAVHFTRTPVAEVDLTRIGPLVEGNARFPQHTNFEIVNVESRTHLRARVWERGVGMTLACGTGAAATLVAARLHGLVEERATVSLPGGDLELSWDGEGPVFLEGPAAYAFEGIWSDDGHA